MADGSVVVVGGTGGLGREVARHYHEEGHPVIITGRDHDRSTQIAGEIGDGMTGLAFDLAEPDRIGDALADVGPVSRLVLAAIARDNNPVRDYTIEGAIYLTTMKLVGYTETVHTLLDRLSDDSSVVLFGGRAKDRPLPRLDHSHHRQRRRRRTDPHLGHRVGTDSVQRHPSRHRR